ncbi:FkbM family methyltransferase [Nitzschia inconspicua]|uniref:FkbM family methyltransferase n=1 Tax=Nitzschia inconspicua TaxID=303405 RepID=A0A9K3PHP7_9STRA|nr:FkbM family methyltransferase [Nitzschia inconspicua]
MAPVTTGGNSALNWRGRALKKRPSNVMLILVILTTIFYMPIWIGVNMNGGFPRSSGMELGIPPLERFVAQSRDTSISRRIQASVGPNTNAKINELQDRVRYLETKLNAYLAFASDPFLSNRFPAKCNNEKLIKDLACVGNEHCALDNQVICLDNFPNIDKSVLSSSRRVREQNTVPQRNQECIVYDFGIRESPEYGLAFAKAPFDCTVVGFDPSPISLDWWKNNHRSIRKNHPKYDFMGVGAGGVDGPLQLHEYDWGQVSILEYPKRVIDTTNCTAAGACRYKFYNQKSFTIPVKTLKTIMTELGHQHITLLKLDVEGSEYTFLEKMIDDLSCRNVDQLTLEWHHYDYDSRYGVTSNPQINVLVALLKDRCGLEQYSVHPSGGWPSNQKLYAEMGFQLYYTLSSFKRTQWTF